MKLLSMKISLIEGECLRSECLIPLKMMTALKNDYTVLTACYGDFLTLAKKVFKFLETNEGDEAIELIIQSFYYDNLIEQLNEWTTSFSEQARAFHVDNMPLIEDEDDEEGEYEEE
jgi:hypothetical protein